MMELLLEIRAEEFVEEKLFLIEMNKNYTV
jgi:hypothetical protein